MTKALGRWSFAQCVNAEEATTVVRVNDLDAVWFGIRALCVPDVCATLGMKVQSQSPRVSENASPFPGFLRAYAYELRGGGPLGSAFRFSYVDGAVEMGRGRRQAVQELTSSR